ncbi:LAMI_0F12068g1_1 [Lachancea mirantina]|uniref:LAMI_0F12068g1_1 n=1 Tax=Lachancea mirantina TaxID=1230905 RepID=A0A1G4K2Q9_9SACH|nr:LAMI_0F12068g1_1 [Lachancea mirantina]
MNPLSLRGSTRVISEFFEYSINTILYQRAIYPPEDFSTVRKYELNLLKTHDDALKRYVKQILQQVHRWILGEKCKKLVLCIIDKDTCETVERWEFSIDRGNRGDEGDGDDEDAKETQRDIRALIRQITASVTFLPELSDDGSYTFNVLAYTDANAKVPLEWADSDAQEIQDGESVQFRGFSTGGQQVTTRVSYKVND